MPNMMSLTDEIAIDVPVDIVYARVSDVTAMGHWSPENTGGTILGSDQIIDMGTVFDGFNKRGRMVWTTRCVVTAAEPNVRFAFQPRKFRFRGPFLPFPIPTTWTYAFRALDEKRTLVAETWTIGPLPALLLLVARRLQADGITVTEMQRRNLRITLQNLKSRLEVEHKVVSPGSRPG